MAAPKILVFAGSIRTGSLNQQLADAVATEITRTDADVTRLSLADYPMPLYNGDAEAQSGPPDHARALKAVFAAHAGVFIVSPEYNASVTPLLKNTLDWIARVRDKDEPPLAAYKNRVFALGGASNGTYGAMRSLIALRQILELGCGALVIPEQIAVREAASAFNDEGGLKDERNAGLLKNVVARLVAMARIAT